MYLKHNTNATDRCCIMVVVVRFIRCAKKLGITKVELYSDEKREWMREYSALGSKVSLASASIL